MPFVSYSLPENNGMSSTLPSESSQISDELAVLASEFEGLEAEYNCSLEHSVCEGPSASPASLEFRVEVSSSSESTPVTSEQRVGELVSFEPTPHDSREQEDVQQFLSDTCKCSLGPGGTPCCLSLSMETIRRSRDKCAELTRNELDLVIMAQIHSLRTAKHEACKGATSSTFRPLSSYYIHGVKICQVTFLFLHRVSRKRYLRIVNLYDTEGLVTSVHGNTGRLPKNTCTLEQVEAMKTFVENYARAHGLPVPGRLPNARDKVTLLPSDISKMFVYRKYKEAAATPVGKSKFLSLWDELTPHVAVMKPSSDLCFTCQQNNLAIMKSANMPEAIRRQRFDKAANHLQRARTAPCLPLTM